MFLMLISCSSDCSNRKALAYLGHTNEVKPPTNGSLFGKIMLFHSLQNILVSIKNFAHAESSEYFQDEGVYDMSYSLHCDSVFYIRFQAMRLPFVSREFITLRTSLLSVNEGTV